MMMMMMMIIISFYYYDCDLGEAFFVTQKENNIRARFKWVKGHQDNKTRYKDLPLEAQLTVDADELAGEYQDKKNKENSIQ